MSNVLRSFGKFHHRGRIIGVPSTIVCSAKESINGATSSSCSRVASSAINL